jgi:Sulfotransferase family
MHVDYVRKIIFFHNPKTAGRSTIAMLGLAEDKHFKLTHFEPAEARRCIFQDGWDEFLSFSFVRNPWDRMASLYEFHRSVEYGVFQHMNISHVLARTYDFEEWLRVNDAGVARSNYFGMPQSNWTAGVSRVYQFEDYTKAIDDLAAMTGTNPRSVHVNASRRQPYRDYYKSDKSIDIVARIDADTIEKYGYQF